MKCLLSIDRWTISRCSFPLLLTLKVDESGLCMFNTRKLLGAYNQLRNFSILRSTLIHLSAIEEATSISETSLSSWINSFTFYSLFIWLVQRKWKNTGLVRVVQLGPDLPEVPNWIVCPENNWFNWTCQINLMIMWLQIMFLFQDVVVVVDSKGKFSDFEFSRLKRIFAFW